MSRRNTKSQAVIESLLDERRQYQEWLDKLAIPGAAGAPSLVVERVRADYQSRLDNVTRQLARHEGELQASRTEAELRRDVAAGQRTARQDALAEAVLRHEVGEYGDEKFAALSAEHTALLAQLAEEIESADRDISRLEEVLGLIARALPEAAPLAAAETVAKAAAPLHGLDELSFLRSMAGDAKPGPAEPTPERVAEPVRAPRPSRPAMPPAALAPTPAPLAPERPAPAPAAPAPPAPAPAAPARLESRRAPEPGPDLQPEPRPDRAPDLHMGDLPLPMPVHQIVPNLPSEPKPSARQPKRVSPATEAADDAARKSLRCTECGTYNFPTEWYCEKCGAELSAF